jgi:hypothetical protein
MFKSEPKTILQFLATHFDFQLRNEVIPNSHVTAALKEFGSDIENQLFEHKFLVDHNDDYVINEPYFVLFEFVLQQFKPLLPEEIEKFGQSIRNLFLKIKEGINEDKNILLDRIEALSNEIRGFRNAVTNNTISLLNESRELKANTRKIDYQEKVQKARYLIDYYINPLNTILDIDHSQSIYNELLAVSQFSNNRRFDYSDEGIRRQFEKLYNLLRQVVKDISQQSTILTNELLPLLDRIRTESEYLQGFHLYLENMNCYKGIKPPKLFNTTRDNPYNPYIYENTKAYLEQFKNEADVFIEEEANDLDQWIFDKNEYKSQLNSKLPVTDFFTWCKEAIEEDKKDFDIQSYFMVTSLIFEEEYDIELDHDQRSISLETKKAEFIMPKFNIRKKENVSQ